MGKIRKEAIALLKRIYPEEKNNYKGYSDIELLQSVKLAVVMKIAELKIKKVGS